MPAADFHLVALIPPGSVQAEIGRLQSSIFSRCGLVSALALPPLIPVGFIGAGAADRALLEHLDGATRAPWKVTTRRLSWVDRHLYLEVDSGATWSTLRARARERNAADPAGLFPLSEGFFLGCGEATPEQRALDGVQAPDASFSSCEIAVLRILAPRGRERWWCEVYWEILAQRPLRGRRES